MALVQQAIEQMYKFTGSQRECTFMLMISGFSIFLMIEAFIFRAVSYNTSGCLEYVKSVTGAISDLDENYLSELKNHGAAEKLELSSLQEIAFFQWAMLDLSIAKIKFEIDWFEDFRKNMN